MSSHHRPSASLIVEVHDLSRRSGSMRELTRTATAPADMGVALIGVPEGSPVELDLRLEAVGEGILVTGSATFALAGECARCLVPVTDSGEADLQELYYYPGHGPQDAEEESHWIVNETIDLEPVLRDAVVLDLPFTPLCREDCAGLCAQCGASLNDDPGHSHGDTVSDRWAGLAGWTESPS